MLGRTSLPRQLVHCVIMHTVPPTADFNVSSSVFLGTVARPKMQGVLIGMRTFYFNVSLIWQLHVLRLAVAS